MINFNVRHISLYKTLIIEANETNISLGLLDKAEAIDLAKQLIGVAGELLPSECNEQDELLGKIIGSLDWIKCFKICPDNKASEEEIDNE